MNFGANSNLLHITVKLVWNLDVYKRNKKRSECIVELYIKHAGFFKNTREVLEKHESQANASRTSRVFLKIPSSYITQQCTRNKFFISFNVA